MAQPVKRLPQKQEDWSLIPSNQGEKPVVAAHAFNPNTEKVNMESKDLVFFYHHFTMCMKLFCLWVLLFKMADFQNSYLRTIQWLNR